MPLGHTAVRSRSLHAPAAPGMLQPIVRILPLLIYLYVIALLILKFGGAWCVAASAELIGVSNVFKLTVAATVSRFGMGSAPRWPPWWACWSKYRLMLSVVSIVTAPHLASHVRPQRVFRDGAGRSGWVSPAIPDHAS